MAFATATELDFVSLPDALELVLLLVDDPRRFRRAALRWHAGMSRRSRLRKPTPCSRPWLEGWYSLGDGYCRYWCQKEEASDLLGEDFPQTLQAARAGSEWAWASVYRDLAPTVLGYLRGRGAHDAEDVTGEVFLQIVRDLHRFAGDERAFRAWVFVIAHHRLVDEGRRRARRPVESTAEVKEDERRSGNVEEEALDRVAADRVCRIIERLSPDQREVLLLRVLGALTVAEVAEVLGKSQGAVKALQRRGLEAVKRELSQEGVTL